MADSHLLTTASGSRLRCHAAVTGVVRWETNAIQAGSPAEMVKDGPLGGYVFVGSYDGWIYRLAFSTGAQVDKLPLWSPHVQNAVRGVAYADGVVFATVGALNAAGHGLYAHELGAGPKWKHDMDDLAWGRPVVFDGIVYAGSWDGRLYAIGVNGTPAWISTAYDFWAAQPIVANGIVYAEAWNRIVALDAKTGAVLWETVPGNEANISGPLACGAGRIYAATAWGGRLYAFDAASGAELWSVSAGGHPTPPMYWQGRVFAATEHGAGNGYLKAFDAADGHLLWTSQVPVGSSGDAVSRPTLDEGILTNHVFVTSQNGNAYGFDSGSGLLKWQASIGGGWPVDSTWTDAAVVEFPQIRPGYVAIDPLALVLRSDIYVKLKLPYPPPVETVVVRLRRAAGGLNERERRDVQRQFRQLREIAAVMEQALEKSAGR